MSKTFKVLASYLEELWTKWGRILRKKDRRGAWKITESVDMKQISDEVNTDKHYELEAYGAKKCNCSGKEIDRIGGGIKSGEDVSGWKAELMKFKVAAEEFNAEFEETMTRRAQHISKL